MKKIGKNLLKFVADIAAINLAFLFTVVLMCNFDGALISGYMNSFSEGILFSLTYGAMVFLTGGYMTLWHWAGTRERIRFSVRSVISLLPYAILHGIFAHPPYKAGYYVLSLIFAVISLLGLRVAYKQTSRYVDKVRDRKNAVNDGKSPAGRKVNVMIIGAGSAGNNFCRIMQGDGKFSDYRVKCFIDNDVKKIGKELCGVKVVGNVSTIPQNVKKYGINFIAFAIPSCAPKIRAEILKICSETGCDVRVLPAVEKLIKKGEVIAEDLGDLKIEDLIGRKSERRFDREKAEAYIKGKTVLAIGGGGTLCSEICSQVVGYGAKHLVMTDVYENKLYTLRLELGAKYEDKIKAKELEITALVGSVRDEKRINSIFEKYRPDIVFHTAAYKYESLMEKSPEEAIKNNIIGTYNVVRAADKYGAEKCIVISSEKAKDPTDITGVTRRICEMIVRETAKNSKTGFASVRIGTVLESAESAIHDYVRQINKGGPVIVPDESEEVCILTASETGALIIEAGADAKDGEIFGLKADKPVKVLTLVENMIRITGRTPYRNMEIKISDRSPKKKAPDRKPALSEDPETSNEIIRIEDDGFDKLDGKLPRFSVEEFLNAVRGGKDIRECVSGLIPSVAP